MKWINRLRLVDDARLAWKWASVRLAMLFGMAVTAIAADPTILKQLLDALPQELLARVPFAVALGAIAGALPILARIVRLVKEGGDDDADR